MSDKGSGVPYVYVTVIRITNGGTAYCLTPAKKWKKWTTSDQYLKYCALDGVKLKPSKGKWSLKLPAGLTKGYIGVDAWTWDWADNYTPKYREAALTKS
ncbi:hypothetical protein [Actinoplanes sp. NBRC 101535]|uniref:hypothetical protein n=1 Tax=Actinoplanes sp. NBRC 101535 TaxID=3032196 RepID=UPI0024A135FB|nr:hypothetical protein [Actinoplanes sp. NBRC 101535]GLY03372.1 hypothetical protein Acsp01_37510 [Actinoplanes sp. NBRC 101535]